VMSAPLPTYSELLDRVERLQLQVDALQAENARLKAELEHAQRQGKRQAAPFRKGPPKPDPNTPGRKSGNAHGRHGHRPPPGQVSECHDATLPDACPDCQGLLVETAVADQFQTEIPRQPVVRQFRVHIGHCTGCGRRVQGRHPLQTSDALGAAASQVGPDAQAAATLLHTQAGLSHGKVAAVFDTLFGIDLTRGASAQINLRAAARLEPDYRAVLDELPSSEQIAADETGWRIGGQPAWLHVWVGDRATAYGIDPRRSAAVLEEVIGADWDGILSHDGFASYERFTEAIHQQCVAHPLRRARDLLAVATRGAVHFPRQVIGLFTEAIHQRNRCLRGEVTPEQLADLRDEFDDRLLGLTRPRRALAEYERLAQHLWAHSEQWLTFLTDPSVEATNWKAEQALRPAVVNRKVWGGNRTAAGAHAQSVLMTVLETCRRQAHAALDYISHTLRSVGNLLLPRPVLLPTR
jgi:transposase